MLSNFHYLLWSEAWKNPKIFSLMVWSFPFAKYWFFPTFLQQRKQIHVTGTREIQARGQTSCIDSITLKSSTMSPNQRNKTFPMQGVCPRETFDLLLFLWLVLSPRGTEGHLHGTSAVRTAAGDQLLLQPACQSACCPGRAGRPTPQLQKVLPAGCEVGSASAHPMSARMVRGGTILALSRTSSLVLLLSRVSDLSLWTSCDSQTSPSAAQPHCRLRPPFLRTVPERRPFRNGEWRRCLKTLTGSWLKPWGMKTFIHCNWFCLGFNLHWTRSGSSYYPYKHLISCSWCKGFGLTDNSQQRVWQADGVKKYFTWYVFLNLLPPLFSGWPSVFCCMIKGVQKPTICFHNTAHYFFDLSGLPLKINPSRLSPADPVEFSLSI